MNLSKNFTLYEATRSSKAIQKGIDNSMDTKTLINAEYFAKNVLQPVRDKVGIPFLITSWYRCPLLNKVVGGVSNSAHLTAMAIDFNIQGKTTKESFALVLVALKDLRIPFDQLIIEKNTKTGATWVHLGVKKTGNRNQTLKLEV